MSLINVTWSKTRYPSLTENSFVSRKEDITTSKDLPDDILLLCKSLDTMAIADIHPRISDGKYKGLVTTALMTFVSTSGQIYEAKCLE